MARGITKDQLIRIIAEGNAVELVKEAEAFGAELAGDKLSKSQIRNIFGEVRNLQAEWSGAGVAQAGEDASNPHVRALLLLKPRMAYQRSREPKTAGLVKVLSDGIDIVMEAQAGERRQRFEHFVELFEAILAYYTDALTPSNQRG